MALLASTLEHVTIDSLAVQFGFDFVDHAQALGHAA
jgi:hypothetical protein